MPGPFNDELEHEHAAWLEIVRLTKAGATITDDDWNASPGSSDTPGQELIGALRKWGGHVALLRISQGKDGIRYAQSDAEVGKT